MTLAGVLKLGRRQAESRMTQTWRVGELVESTDPITFDPIQSFVAVYDGPGRLKSVQATSVSDREVGGQPVAMQVFELHLPSGTTGITPDMRAICDDSPEDASLVGRVVRVKGFPAAGQTTAARFSVEESGEVIEEGS